MARILLLQEKPGPIKELKRSLQEHHELLLAKTIAEALAILAEQEVDLIIAMVHLEQANVFEFLETVKQDPRVAHIPFICFCAKLNKMALQMNSNLAKAAVALGADKYLALEPFCSVDGCDFDQLRLEIESCLR